MEKVISNLSLQIWFFGFMSGFSILINGNTLNFWLAYEGINKSQIGLFSIVLLPYSINFLWMPWLESKELKPLSSILGHRVSWVIISQLLLLISIVFMSTMSPIVKLYEICIIAFIISFLVATQNTMLCSIRTTIVPHHRQGELSSKYIFGYKMGMLLAGTGSIYASSLISWQAIYQLFACSVLIFTIILLLISCKLQYNTWDKLIIQQPIAQSLGIYQYTIFVYKKVTQPIGNFYTICSILFFLAIYQLPDNLIAAMLNSFLLELQFTPKEIASAGRLCGNISSIIGSVLAGYIMRNVKILRCMFYCGIVHAIAHLCYMILAIYGKSILLLIVSSIVEGVTAGVLMSSYIAFISSLCKGKYKATQYALFSAMMGVARSLFPMIAGYLVNYTGWETFFVLVAISAIIISSYTQLLTKYLKY